MSTKEPFELFRTTWETNLVKEVNGFLKENPTLTQLEARARVSEELHNSFSAYEGRCDIHVTPKGNDQIQVNIVLAPHGCFPTFKFKPRFVVPSTVAEPT